jgi:hypothetical protein
MIFVSSIKKRRCLGEAEHRKFLRQAVHIHMFFLSLLAMMVWMTFALIFLTSNGSPSWCSTSVHSIGSSGENTSLLSRPSAKKSRDNILLLYSTYQNTRCGVCGQLGSAYSTLSAFLLKRVVWSGYVERQSIGKSCTGRAYSGTFAVLLPR